MAADSNTKSENSVNMKYDNASESQPLKKIKTENEKAPGESEDVESLGEQILDIGEHYLVRRSDNSWRKFVTQYLYSALPECFCLLPVHICVLP